MRKIPNVVRRGGVYHFRRAFPQELKRRLRRDELTCSLRTADLRIAQVLSRKLYLASDYLFQRLAAASMLTDDQLARLVQDFYATVLRQEDDGRLNGTVISEQRRRARAAYYGELAERTKQALARNELQDASWVTGLMLQKHGFLGSASEKDIAKAKQVMLRAGIDLALAMKARFEGDFNYAPRDTLLQQELAKQFPAKESSPPAAVVAGSLIFSESAAAFCDEQALTKAWENQTVQQARKSYALFAEICGDRALPGYTRQDAGTFKSTVQQLPAAYGKAALFKNMAVKEILAHQAASDAGRQMPLINSRTVKRHMSALSALWRDAIARGNAAENIFSGFRFPSTKRANEQRAMWLQEDLRKLFQTPVWTGCSSQARRSTPGELIVRDEKFWLPLIALFSGMRQEEICQLQIEDVCQMQDIWVFDINSRPPRQLKNRNAIRLVPVHSELIGLGLINYVETQRLARQTRIFPNLTPGGADQRLGHGYTKWFTRYRRELGIYRQGMDFHSLRHTATTLLHQSGVADSIIDRLTGHATPGETARYTKSSDLRQLKDAIELISPGLNLSYLHTSDTR